MTTQYFFDHLSIKAGLNEAIGLSADVFWLCADVFGLTREAIGLSADQNHLRNL
jgi:hypothetical protein